MIRLVFISCLLAVLVTLPAGVAHPQQEDGNVESGSKCYAMGGTYFIGVVQSGGATSGTASRPPNGFLGYKWGVPPNNQLKKYSGPADDGSTMYVLASKKTTPSAMFEVLVDEEAYVFISDKFYSGIASFAGKEKAAKLRKALLKAYGQPSFINEQLNLWIWKWPGSEIEVRLWYESERDRTQVTFSNEAI